MDDYTYLNTAIMMEVKECISRSLLPRISISDNMLICFPLITTAIMLDPVHWNMTADSIPSKA